jgi:hypothetical protein
MMRNPIPMVAMPIQETYLSTVIRFDTLRKLGRAMERRSTIIKKPMSIP